MTPVPDPIDISDLPDGTPVGIKSFVSYVREGYYTKQGNYSHWKKAVGTIAQYSPALHFLLCVAVGASMRPMLQKMPGAIVHLKGTSTTGKSIALQTVLSLRADPSDMTWCFDSMSTLKWYTIAAENNFLCLDDTHMAILPDNNSACKPMSPSFFQQFDKDNAPHCTIISTGVPGIDTLADGHLKNALEIDAQWIPLWPHPEHLQRWWMDYWINELRMHYGHAREKILDSLSQKTDFWTECYEKYWNSLPAAMPPGKRSVFVQAQLGRLWLQQHADIVLDDFAVYDLLLKKSNKSS